MNFVTGGSGVLGREIVKRLKEVYAPTRESFDLGSGQFKDLKLVVTTAYLCAGTKGFAECEGNLKAFRSDVDGNIRLIRDLRKQGAFVVFISTDAVERIDAAYSRNRLLVEQFLWTQSNCAVIRPERFNEQSAPALAHFCIAVGTYEKEGVHYWP